ncbi:beta-mannosidase [Deinococcus sp.]|uniref:beta-mannosidase n=1 Tax=Deinococcus sp. TaxID=47478 RepID=UPI003B5C49F4
MSQRPLHSGWQFKARAAQQSLGDDFASVDGWLPANVPGTVHQDLLNAGRIPDPFYGLNELDVQWVGETDWLYRLAFDAPALEGGQHAELCFDGLDTFAQVWLNGEPILTSDNMFVPQRVEVTGKLKAGRNDLHILFDSAWRRGRELEAQHGELPLWNGDSSRLHVRKAQYHYGWDWGPMLLTAGLWRGVRLELYRARIAELSCEVALSDDLSQAIFPARLTLAGEISGTVKLELLGPGDRLLDSVTMPAAETIEHTFELGQPERWWPAGYGQQPLYTVRASLEDGTETQSLRVGVRRLKLVQESVAGEEGRSFTFQVNGVPIFCGGANWIPDDSFLPRITPGRYRTRLTQARDANMVMLRVWGGGIYEDDAFYDACDELGLLVWQDFMFACGLYPAHSYFLDNVRREAEAAVQRLRHHPSLALWCGNNEDYQLAQSVGAYGPGGDESRFPALTIYQELLPEVCARLDPARPYWPGSPSSGSDPNSPVTGDRHAWDVWHGEMAPYQDYPQYQGRFVSEFGMQSLPSLSLLESVTPQDQRFVDSRVLTHHNKAEGGPRRLNAYLDANVPTPTDLPGYVYASQLMQAEALACAYRGWRRRWGEVGRRAVSGALVWQLNDCWPVTSWAVIDSSGQPKPAYYAVKRVLSRLSVGLTLTDNGAQVWAVNGTQTRQTLTLELRTLNLSGLPVVSETRPVTLAANAVTECGIFEFAASEPALVVATLSRDGQLVAREVCWPEPLKNLELPDPGLIARVSGSQVRLSVAAPAKGVWLESAPDTVWDDNFLDLLPGEVRVVTAQQIDLSRLTVRWLGAGESLPINDVLKRQS